MKNKQEYGFSLTFLFPYKDRIIDSVLMRENTGQGKPAFSHVLRNVLCVSKCQTIYGFTIFFLKKLIYCNI